MVEGSGLPRTVRLVVKAGCERLDRYVVSQIKDLSRSQVQNLIKSGAVLRNGRLAKPAALVRQGDVVEIDLPPDDLSKAPPQDIKLRVVYESDQVAVVDKPAGMLVHPAGKQMEGTLVNALLWRYPEIASVGPPGRQGIVHRLDKNTSGLIIVARTVGALRRLQAQFRRHEVWKTYQALVVGRLQTVEGVIDAPVGRHPRARSRMAVVRAGGRPARTQYKVLRDYGGYSYVQVHPLTGRTHQIRVHFAAIGHPVAGDPVYGRGSRDFALDRQFLHACALRFVDPAGDVAVEVKSPTPAELREVLDALEEGASLGNVGGLVGE